MSGIIESSKLVICFNCGVDCTNHFFMCDKSYNDDKDFCPECFAISSCGRGLHGEGCSTMANDGINSAGASRLPDMSRVKVRQQEFTKDQQTLKNIVAMLLPKVSDNAEVATGILVSVLSDFLIANAKPDLLPEAVATAVACLEYNCGIVSPVKDAMPIFGDDRCEDCGGALDDNGECAFIREGRQYEPD